MKEATYRNRLLILKECQKNGEHRDSVSQIIYVHQKIIYKVCKTYRNTPEDQEDLFQEIVYQLWKSYPSFMGASKISSWMYRIALNTAIAIYRKPKLPVVYVDKLPEQTHAMHPVSENEERLFDALRTLNDTDKALISLYLEDFTYQEIAAITGITESNTGVRLNRIKQKLKETIN
ncbi:MAG: sigma-70 family RNA polymerase sigma factor [Ferruginibacter sp.]